MSIAAGVYRGGLCTNTTNVEAYFHQAFPQIYLVTEYSGGWKEFLAELLNYYCVFLWSFMDIFIVGISKCLSTRLNQFNEYLLKFKGMVCRMNYSVIFVVFVATDEGNVFGAL